MVCFVRFSCNKNLFLEILVSCVVIVWFFQCFTVWLLCVARSVVAGAESAAAIGGRARRGCSKYRTHLSSAEA